MDIVDHDDDLTDGGQSREHSFDRNRNGRLVGNTQGVQRCPDHKIMQPRDAAELGLMPVGCDPLNLSRSELEQRPKGLHPRLVGKESAIGGTAGQNEDIRLL